MLSRHLIVQGSKPDTTQINKNKLNEIEKCRQLRFITEVCTQLAEMTAESVLITRWWPVSNIHIILHSALPNAHVFRISDSACINAMLKG